MTDIRAIDWRSRENQQAVQAAMQDARELIFNLEASGQLELVTAKVLMGLVQTAQFSYKNLISGSETESISFMAWPR